MCPESISTVSVVSHCPSNAMEWSSAARRKSCNDIGKVQTCTTKSDTFAYHCVLNKEATMLLELCAPVLFMNGEYIEFLVDFLCLDEFDFPLKEIVMYFPGNASPIYW